jgi:predicted site-specific integrase-resolvase
MELSGQWLSLMEYATRNDVSLSTLRRHIKASKVRFKTENGRYFIWNDQTAPIFNGQLTFQTSPSTTSVPARDPSYDDLKLQLQKAREEIAELKTLVAFYEDQSESLRASS